MTDEEKFRAARALIGNPLFEPLIIELQMDAYREWSSTAEADQTRRETAYHKHQSLEQLLREIQSLGEEG